MYDMTLSYQTQFQSTFSLINHYLNICNFSDCGTKYIYIINPAYLIAILKANKGSLQYVRHLLAYVS